MLAFRSLRTTECALHWSRAGAYLGLGFAASPQPPDFTYSGASRQFYANKTCLWQHAATSPTSLAPLSELKRSFASSVILEQRTATNKDNGAAAPTAYDTRDVNAILQHIAVREFRTTLECLSESKQTVSTSNMTELLLRQKVAISKDDALKIIEAMHTGGVILRHKDQIYLNPEEVAELVIRALPDTVEEAQAKVRDIQEQLRPMERKLKEIDSAAKWRTNLLAYAGFALLTVQNLIFARLTYWELSWDVMEPISYFTGQAAMLAMYLYYLMTQRNFSYRDHFSAVVSDNRAKMLAQCKFDAALYEQLHRDQERWQRYLKQFAKS